MEHVMVGVDGSDASHRAVRVAAELAAALDASLHVVHAHRSHGTGQVPRHLAEYERLEHVYATEAELIRSAAAQTAADAAEQARAAGASDVETEVVDGDPASILVDRARQVGADMLVVGRRGLGDLTGMLLGSVSHKVTHHADCPVLTVP